MNDPHTILFTIVTVAAILVSGALIIFSNDPAAHTLAIAVITAVLGLWVPSPVQPKQP